MKRKVQFGVLVGVGLGATLVVYLMHLSKCQANTFYIRQANGVDKIDFEEDNGYPNWI